LLSSLEKLPIYPGCDDSSNETAKECLSEKIKNFVNANFNTNAVKPYAQKGVNRVYVRFTISKEGDIKEVEARASAPQLAEEAERVIALLPDMTPGEKGGEAVNALYTLPIFFQIDEDTSN